MNIPSYLLPPDWLFFADVVGAVVFWQAIRHAPWRQLRAAGLQQLFAGSVVALLLLWNLSAGLKPGLGFHFLGVTVFTLMFGWSFGVLGVGLAAFGLALKGGGLAAMALNALLFGVLPVSVSYLVYQWVDRRLPHHIFLSISICAPLWALCWPPVVRSSPWWDYWSPIMSILSMRLRSRICRSCLYFCFRRAS